MGHPLLPVSGSTSRSRRHWSPDLTRLVSWALATVVSCGHHYNWRKSSSKRPGSKPRNLRPCRGQLAPGSDAASLPARRTRAHLRAPSAQGIKDCEIVLPSLPERTKRSFVAPKALRMRYCWCMCPEYCRNGLIRGSTAQSWISYRGSQPVLAFCM